MEAYYHPSYAIPPRDCAYGDLGLLRLSRAEFMGAFRLFLEGGLYSDAFYVADGVLTLEELKNFRRLAGHLHEYRALSTPQHARQTPLLSVQSERLQCAPTMAESCTPKAEIRRRAKFDLLLSHLIGDRECPLPRPKISPVCVVGSRSHKATLMA